MRIGITGASGFLGWHLRVWLRTHRPDVEVRTAGREEFGDPGSLVLFCRGLDAVIHCAGMNRGADHEVQSGNIELAEKLVAACRIAAQQSGAFPGLVFANSTHVERDSAYAMGKRSAASLLEAEAARQGTVFSNVILPNLFGEYGRPFYNSVVSTFCHQLTRGKKPEVHRDSATELLHAQRAAMELVEAAELGRSGQHRPVGVKLAVGTLLKKLTEMHQSYNDLGIVPSCEDVFDKELFNTLRSYNFPDQVGTSLRLSCDERGNLFETMKSSGGGQVFLSTTHPGITRGNHYHTRKFERFVVCSGNAEISLRRLFDDKVITLSVSGEEPCAVDMPTFATHSIRNIGSTPLITMFWADEIFDPKNPDTYSEAVHP